MFYEKIIIYRDTVDGSFPARVDVGENYYSNRYCYGY